MTTMPQTMNTRLTHASGQAPITLLGTAFALMAATMFLITATAQAQPRAADGDDDMASQQVDSRKGYVARIPGTFRLDSNASGWSRKGRYEIRVYRMPGVGSIRIICTVKPVEMPRDTINNGAYIYTQMDSATERGNAVIRTYYLATRSVRIELIPASIRMVRYLEAAPDIFATFRWKPGANSDAIETDPPAGAAGR